MRIRQFIIDLLTLQSNQVQMPPGLGIVAPEIKESAGRFCRIGKRIRHSQELACHLFILKMLFAVIHNREVFKDIYSRIIDELLVEKRSLTIPVSSTWYFF